MDNKALNTVVDILMTSIFVLTFVLIMSGEAQISKVDILAALFVFSGLYMSMLALACLMRKG